MRRADIRRWATGAPVLAGALMIMLILIGALTWFRPYLDNKKQAISGVPASTGLFAASEFPVPPHGQACMSTVAVDRGTQVAEFQVRPVKSTPRGGPPVELVLSAPGYRATLSVPGGYPGGSVALPITPPSRAEIGTACFVNRGKTTVLFGGTSEARSVSRSHVQIDGHSVAGDIALAFLERHPLSLLDHLGEIFSHASNLTDRLLPVWMIWILAVLVTFSVPCGMIAAFYLGLREDQTAGRL